MGKGWGAQRVSPALPCEGRQGEEQTWEMLQGGEGVGGTGCGLSHTSPCVGLRVLPSPRYLRGRTAETASNTAANGIRASLISPRAMQPNLAAGCLGAGADGERWRGAPAAPTWGGGSEDGLLSPLQG